MYQEIPNGTKMKIGFDDEFIEVNLPPVGYCLDRMPDPKTGKPSMKLVKCEILGDDLPKKEQKFTRTKLPKNWYKWLKDEKAIQKNDPEYFHPEAEAFRAQEWKRRINGVWIALGNKNNKPTEYVYLTGLAYFYFTWWIIDFIPKFRLVYLKLFYALQWADDNPNCYGIVLSTLRRFGKTAILGCWMYEYCTRVQFAYGGMQAKNKLDAKGKFLINIVDPWRRLPEFFRPKHFDKSGQNKNSIVFKKTAERGEGADNNFDIEQEDEVPALGGHIDYRETKASAYDQAKLHRYALEEPGKWEEEDVYLTLNTIKPAVKENDKIIGRIFAPTTIEELEKGGDKFIEIFEHSFPSLMKKSVIGQTISGLIAVFIPAYEGYTFDEYGRSVVEDPKPNEIVIGEDGQRILIGAKRNLAQQFKEVENNPQLLIPLKRKYPFTWEDAKSTSAQDCHFDALLLNRHLNYLNSIPDDSPLYVKGNFEWVNEVDGDVEFLRDDTNGRFHVAWLPDQQDENSHERTKNINLVGVEYDLDGKPQYYPMNNDKFRIGTDPIRNTVTDDPRASKAAAYVFRLYDASVDLGKDPENYDSYRFIVQYLVRPDFDTYAEDMIKVCRYFGCSILPEENVSNIRQHMEARGYGQFILYRRNFDPDVLKIDNKGEAGDKGVDSHPEVIDTYVRFLDRYYKKHISKIPFKELIEQSLKFRIKKHFMQDAVVGAGFTLLASKARTDFSPDEDLTEAQNLLFPLYDQEGQASKLQSA